MFWAKHFSKHAFNSLSGGTCACIESDKSLIITIIFWFRLVSLTK